MNTKIKILLGLFILNIIACAPETEIPPAPAFHIYSIFLEWDRVSEASYYKVSYGRSRSSLDKVHIQDQISDFYSGIKLRIITYPTLYFLVQACNSAGCSDNNTPISN